MEQERLSHTDGRGSARMVDIGAKAVTHREASAEAIVKMRPETLAMIVDGTAPKGDVFAVARVAGIQAAKRTADLIPLCHPIPITKAAVDLEPQGDRVRIVARCATDAKTGIEMEALTAAATAALTLYDMCKAVDRGMEIVSVRLLEKSGGASGTWVRETQTDKQEG